MQLIKDLELSLYPQYTTGAKLQQLNSSARVTSYTGKIPCLPFYALIDLYLFMHKVGYWRFEPWDAAALLSTTFWSSLLLNYLIIPFILWWLLWIWFWMKIA